MEFNKNRGSASVDLRHQQDYWTNRLLLFTRRMEQEGRLWDPDHEVIEGVSDGESIDLRAEFNGIADNLSAAGIDVDRAIAGIETGAISYNPDATDAPVLDWDRESAPPEVLDFDEATVEYSAEEWDANVDWPGYEW